jgi:RHS repeat-associated protein
MYQFKEVLLYARTKTDINNNKATENVLSPAGEIVASKRFDGVYDNMYFFYHYDVRGSVTSILNPNAKRVKGYGYDEFGETEELGSNTFINDVKFTGAVHDTATGLYYMNARHYNPDTGRFISQDTYKGTAHDPWSQHLYTYTTNNPVNFIDPTGHLPIYVGHDGLTNTASPFDVPGSPNYNPSKSKKNYDKKPGITINDVKYLIKNPEYNASAVVLRGELPFTPGGSLVNSSLKIGNGAQAVNQGIKQVSAKGIDKGLATRGYKPEPGERTFEGFVKNNVPVDKETTLHTNSPGFNTSLKNADGQFKRFGTDSHGGLSPHVHQPTRNVNPKTGEIFGGQGRKTGDGGVTSPGKRDVTQLYQYLFNGKYRN